MSPGILGHSEIMKWLILLLAATMCKYLGGGGRRGLASLVGIVMGIRVGGDQGSSYFAMVPFDFVIGSVMWFIFGEWALKCETYL